MEERKEVIESLKTFAKQEEKIVTSELEDILKDIAKTGKYIFPWETLKPLFLHQLEKVTRTFLDSIPPKISDEVDTEKLKELEDLRKAIVDSFSKFSSAPFTIQRLSELLVNPKKHYKTPAKFFRGLEKNVLVVSTVDPEESDERPSKRIKLTNIPEAEQNGLLEEMPKFPIDALISTDALVSADALVGASEMESNQDREVSETVNSTELVINPSSDVSDQHSNQSNQVSDLASNQSSESDEVDITTNEPSQISGETSNSTADEKNTSYSQETSLSIDGEHSLENSDIEKNEEPQQQQPSDELPVQELTEELTSENALESIAQTEQIVPSNIQGSEDTPVASDEPMDQS